MCEQLVVHKLGCGKSPFTFDRVTNIEVMKKLFTILLLLSVPGIVVFAQSPIEAGINTILPVVNISHVQEASTGVVIIDDDELGVTIATNPANNFITITSTKDVTNKTFSLTN